ncbi:MAG: tetratricopeptide repeat protein [Planctomycetes bacterium]|nr:tetratricopeptide repeat protein [Planctomycetota bacterium]
MSSWFDAEDHADRALDMYERGRWAEAEAELRRALALNPHQPEWHFNLGLTLEAAERDGEALACYEQSVSMMPGQIDPLLAAGVVANRLGQYEPALEWFGQVLTIDQHCEPAYAHQIESYVRLGRHDEAETTFYLAQQTLANPSPQCLSMIAESLVERRVYERAEWCLWEALRLDPALPRLRARLGAIHAATGRSRKALQLFLRDLRDDPGNVDTLLDYGEALADLGRGPEASEKFRRILELEPANVDAHHRLGEIALQAGRHEQAHLEFELVLKLDKQYPQIRVALAAALLGRGQVEEARGHLGEEMEKCRQLGAADPRGGSSGGGERFGSLLLQVGMEVEAAEVFKRAIDRLGGTAELYRKLALARFECGDRDGGAAASRHVLRLESGCVVSIHNLALGALEGGRLRAAAGWIDRGLRIDRNDDGLRRLRMRLWWMWLKRACGTVARLGREQR